MDPTAQQSTQPQPVVQEPPIVSKHFNLPRVLLVLLVALIAAGISGAIFYMLGKSQGQQNVSPNPTIISTTTQTKVEVSPTVTLSETANWKIYIDSKKIFQFKYPSNWQIDVDPTGIISIFPPQINITPDGTPKLGSAPTINITSSANSISSYPQGNETIKGVPMVTGWKSVSVNSISGIYYQTHQCAPQCFAHTVLPKNTAGTVDIAISTMAQEQGYTPIYNQLLATFKFIQ